MLFAGVGRCVLGKTVPSVLKYGLWPVNNLYDIAAHPADGLVFS